MIKFENFEKILKFWVMHFLGMTATYNLKTLKLLRLAKKPAKTSKNTPKPENTRREPGNCQIGTEIADFYGFYFRL